MKLSFLVYRYDTHILIFLIQFKLKFEVKYKLFVSKKYSI